MNDFTDNKKSAIQKIMIIGCCGAGKSTLARKLHEITGLELIHLDQHYWNPGWVETEPKEWEEKARLLAAKPNWIIDGNYGGTMGIRLKKADLIVYLDFSTRKCLSRIIKRTLKYHGTPRPDMPADCPERFDLEFLHYVATFNIVKRKSLLKKMDSTGEEKEVVILKNDKAVAEFVAQFSTRFKTDNHETR